MTGSQDTTLNDRKQYHMTEAVCHSLDMSDLPIYT